MGLFSAIDALEAGGAPASQPFDEWFRLSESDVKGHPFFSTRYEYGEEWRKIENDWLGTAGSLALQLDSDTNNTSLVLAFELVESGRVLLFPADAQVGNWMSWNEVEWTVQKGGNPQKVTAQQLLEKTVFYKVGHHGSHNATLRTLGLERMSDASLVGMLPLDRPTAKKMEWNMPFPSLHEALLQRCKGRLLDLELGMPDKPDDVAQGEWDQFAANVDVKPGWVDYKVPMT